MENSTETTWMDERQKRGFDAMLKAGFAPSEAQVLTRNPDTLKCFFYHYSKQWSDVARGTLKEKLFRQRYNRLLKRRHILN